MGAPRAGGGDIALEHEGRHAHHAAQNKRRLRVSSVSFILFVFAVSLVCFTFLLFVPLKGVPNLCCVRKIKLNLTIVCLFFVLSCFVV